MLCLLQRVSYKGLALMAAYAAYSMPPESHPYAFAASAMGIIYGLYGFVGGHEVHESIVKAVIDDFMEFAPLAMVNIDIFKTLGNPYALVHALFIIPLTLDLVAKLFGDACDDVATQMLKHVSNLANVASLLCLSYLEGNYVFSGVALSYLAAHAGMFIGGKCHGYLVDLSCITSYSLFYYAAIWAITAPKNAIE